MSVSRIVCPQCFVQNRVPEERLSEQPKCGKCHEPLFNGKPVAVNAEQFKKMVAGNDIPVIVDFWAEWCGPCKMFSPIFADATARLEPNFRLLKVNTESSPEISRELRIQSIPTIAAFVNGREFTRQAGAMPLAQFLNWVDSNIQASA